MRGLGTISTPRHLEPQNSNAETHARSFLGHDDGPCRTLDAGSRDRDADIHTGAFGEGCADGKAHSPPPASPADSPTPGPSPTPEPDVPTRNAPTVTATKQEVQALFDTWTEAFRTADAALLHSILEQDLARIFDPEKMQRGSRKPVPGCRQRKSSTFFSTQKTQTMA